MPLSNILNYGNSAGGIRGSALLGARPCLLSSCLESALCSALCACTQTILCTLLTRRCAHFHFVQCVFRGRGNARCALYACADSVCRQLSGNLNICNLSRWIGRARTDKTRDCSGKTDLRQTPARRSVMGRRRGSQQEGTE